MTEFTDSNTSGKLDDLVRLTGLDPNVVMDRAVVLLYHLTIHQRRGGTIYLRDGGENTLIRMDVEQR